MKKLLFVLALLFFVFRATTATAVTQYPDYSGYVNDFAHVLSTGFVQQLDQKLLDFEKKTTDQIAVVTIPTTNNDPIEDYSIHLADKWKVGQKGKDNGVIMLFAMQDRKMRIEVGRGLEGDLTDVQSKHIETDVIAPEFKKGDYEAGIDNGVSAVIATISHDASSAAYVDPNAQATTDGVGVFFMFLIIMVVIILIIAFSPVTPLGGRGTWGPTTVWGGGGKDDGDGFGGFGGGGFSGGGSSSSW